MENGKKPEEVHLPPEKLERPFDLAYLYQFYLDKVKLDVREMGPIQKQETRRAFYAGMSTILTVMRDEIPLLPTEEGAIVQLMDMEKQAVKFWKDESGEK